jgi:amino acid transporter
LPAGNINAITGVTDAVGSVSHFLGIVVAIMVCFAVSSQDVAYMNSYSRLLFVSGIEKRLPSIMSYLTNKKVPLPAILVQCIVGIFVIIFFTTQQNLAATFQLYLAALVIVWVASLYYLYIALPIVRSKFKENYETDISIWKIPFKSFGLWFTVIMGLVFNTVAIYYVFANPWTADISPTEWRKWLVIISAVIILSGTIIFLLSNSKVKKIDIDEEIKKYNSKKASAQ